MSDVNVKPEFLDLLRCPACRGPFDPAGHGRAETTLASGSLSCRDCRSAFPVERGIPRFVPRSNYASSFGFQWNSFPGTQLDSRSGHPISRRRFFQQSGWTEESLRGRRVLDVGCGAGRFAEVALSCGATVVAIDYSSAVDACAANLGGSDRLHLAQADIYALPFSPGAFDFVYCFGVLQHTPDVKGAFLALPPMVKPGGHLAVDLYLRNWARWTHPRLWLRPVTTRLPAPLLFRIVRRAVPGLLSVSRLAGRVPAAGPLLQRLVPVANYERSLPLSPAQLAEWAVLDTFDWLAPRYDQPQTAVTLRGWMHEAGLADVEVFRADHLAGRGRKPGAAPMEQG